MRALEIRARRVKTRGEATVMRTTGVFLRSVRSYGSEATRMKTIESRATEIMGTMLRTTEPSAMEVRTTEVRPQIQF